MEDEAEKEAVRQRQILAGHFHAARMRVRSTQVSLVVQEAVAAASWPCQTSNSELDGTPLPETLPHSHPPPQVLREALTAKAPVLLEEGGPHETVDPAPKPVAADESLPHLTAAKDAPQMASNPLFKPAPAPSEIEPAAAEPPASGKASELACEWDG